MELVCLYCRGKINVYNKRIFLGEISECLLQKGINHLQVKRPIIIK